jgi:hypothetical protein
VAEDSELDRLDPEPVTVKLESGFPVEVVRLRTRQMFRLLRILTRGAGPAIGQLDFSEDAAVFGQKLLGLLLVAIPDAEQETVTFLQSMCRPSGLVDKKAQHMTKKDSEQNQELWDRFNEELFNPEIGDTLSLFEVIVSTEAPELQSLGKKLRSLWEVTRKVTGLGQAEQVPEAQDLHLPSSEEPTAPSSTSSAASTDGPTSTSSTSPSAASGSARKRRATADVLSSGSGPS